MVKERINYVSVKEVLSRLMKHPLLKDLDMEQVISYTTDFIDMVGMPAIYTDKFVDVEIHNYRGLLPCDLVSIDQVKETKDNICLRYTTDTFMNGEKPTMNSEPAFKTQGRVIFTTFREGTVNIAYKAIPVDDEGYPLLMDNGTFLKALELYIKKEKFTILFDEGKINPNVLSNTQMEYGYAIKLCTQELIMPSVSQMESIARMWHKLVPNTTSFDGGYNDLGNREYIKH